jgi:ParB family chromosome partitioning protein
MSKRTDKIRSLFSAPQDDVLSADNTSATLPRVSAGAVRSLKDSFSGVERENEELRNQISSGAVVLEIDPSLVDPSPLMDRFVDDDSASFEALKTSIHHRGQEVPILIREHPTSPGRYQSAYGHRRVRAAKELGRSVKAILKNLSDADLVVAQGVENSARQDLSFIERAIFAMRLEDSGYERTIIQEALTIDRAEASKLISVARAVPQDLIAAIGRASKVGRGRWQSLADALKSIGATKRARTAVAKDDFSQQESENRFHLVLFAAKDLSQQQNCTPSDGQSIISDSGYPIARIKRTPKEINLSVDQSANGGFAEFLIEQIPRLFDTYTASNRQEG